MMTSKMTLLLVTAVLSIGLVGCASDNWYPFLYKPTFSQGNNINPNTVAQLKLGMTKTQVVNIMGNPLLETPLSPNTWHYIYVLNEKGKITQQKQVTLYFNSERLERMVY